ncbi:M20 family metallopeptidase [Actinosynnema sp. NPDC050436]|uniref:M20 family metallopeptidase n=1 Tax=Actinosynnema sp. NPDC050436 TaxID=3155659 RepID=UPI0033EEB321
MDLDEFLTLADGLLRIPSTADRPAELAKALEHVLAVVGPGVTTERFESGGKPSALVYRGARRPEFRVLLNAHLDVVPGTPEQFEPRREGSRLYARGAQDMKLSALVLALVFRDVPTSFPLGLQLVTDEEVGGRDGTGHQLDQGVAARFAVIGEHSALRLVTESKGLVDARVDATGLAAHSAYPWLGDNALVRLLRAVDALLDAYPVPTSEQWRTTVNVARVETSNAALNQVPADASAWLDIRFPAEDADFAGRDADEVARHLSALCGLPVEVGACEPPHRADPDGPDVLALRAAARAQGYSGDLLRKHGAADSRYFHQRGVDAVIFGVGGDGQHGPDEHADLDTVLPYYRALRDYLRSLPDA